jgi:hypothetical protein
MAVSSRFRRNAMVALAAMPLITAANQPATILSESEMASARKLYVAKCAKCHKFYEPKKYTQAEWQKWMESMGRKSKLKPEQDALLNRYLDGYRSGQIQKAH